ncbi:hypothetical protein EBR96_06080 [bacterium]|nr:hypothetical protein [bacterium]
MLRPRAIAPIVATSPLAAEPRTATHREAVEAIHYASLGLLVPDAHQADFDRELIQLAYHLNIWSRDFDRLSQATKPTRDDEWIQIANDQFIADETGMDRKLIGKIPTIFDAVQDQLTDSDSGQINIPAYLRRARWGESFFDQ